MAVATKIPFPQQGQKSHLADQRLHHGRGDRRSLARLRDPYIFEEDGVYTMLYLAPLDWC